MSQKIKIAVLGATGFTGEKLVEILISHPNVEITYLSSRTQEPVFYAEIFPRFSKKINLKCERLNIEKAANFADIFFLSLPHTVSMEFAPYLLKQKKKVIDLSADYRLKDTDLYKKYYKADHKDRDNLVKAVYGLPESFKDKIRTAEIIANPGCYPTSILIAIYPLVSERLIDNKIIVDAKSSITGAGRKAVIDYHYSNISNNLWAYKPFVHQHIPETVEVIKELTGSEIKLQFVPQVIGVETGIYSTIYVTFKKRTEEKFIKDIYDKYYKNCPFVRLQKNLPKLKDVAGTNFVDLGFALDNEGTTGLLVSAIDNLIKGAAGQAVQNMNIMMGWEETLSL